MKEIKITHKKNTIVILDENLETDNVLEDVTEEFLPISNLVDEELVIYDTWLCLKDHCASRGINHIFGLDAVNFNRWISHHKSLK